MYSDGRHVFVNNRFLSGKYRRFKGLQYTITRANVVSYKTLARSGDRHVFVMLLWTDPVSL